LVRGTDRLTEIQNDRRRIERLEYWLVPAAIAAAFFVEGTLGYYVVYAIVAVALSVGLSKLSQALAGDQRSNALTTGQNPGRDITLRGTVTPRKLVYGEIRTGGALAYINVGGENNMFLFYVVVYASHQSEDITEYSVDNIRIRKADVDGFGHVTLSHFVENSLNLLTIHTYLGTSTQTVDTDVQTYIQEWDDTHKGKGLTYVVYKLQYDEKIWPNGAPTDLFAVVRGRRLYDPRLDSTAGGSGSQRSNDATTWTWSRNWALAVRDFIAGGSITYDIATPNKRLIGGEQDRRIDDAYVIAAANHADEICTVPATCLAGTTTWTNGSNHVTGIGTQFTYEFPGGTIKLLGPDSNWYTISTVDTDAQITLTGNFTGTTVSGVTTQWNTTTSTTTSEVRFTCDCEISLDATRFASLTTLLSAGIGHLSYTGGKYRVFAGVYDSPGVTLNADDIQGPMDMVTSPNTEDLYNSVGGTFFDEQRAWQQSSFPNQTQSSYQTDDGDFYPRNINLLATRGYFRAQRIANVHLLQSRNKITITFSKLSPKAFQIGEWETFNLNIPEFGYVNQVFRCIEWTFLPDGFISILARIEGSSLYADLASGSYQLPRNVASAAPSGTLPTAPTGLTVLPQPGGLAFIVAGDFIPGTIIELWQHSSSTPFSSATKIAEGEVTSFSVNKADMATDYYWVRSRLDGQVSTTFPLSTGIAGIPGLSSLVPIGVAQITGQSAMKVGGSSGKDSGFYSLNGYDVCHITFKANTPPTSGGGVNSDTIIGLTQSPTTAGVFGTIDFSLDVFDIATSKLVSILELGVAVGSSVPWTTATVFAITYDHSDVRYYVDNALIHTTHAPGLKLYAGGSFQEPNEGVNSLRFGSTTNLSVIDTPQIGINAATDYGSATSASGSRSSLTYSGPPLEDYQDIATITYFNNTPDTQTVEVFSTARFTVTGGATGWVATLKFTGTYPQGAVNGYSSTTEDKLYSYNTSVTVAAGGVATFTLSSGFKTAGSGSTGTTLTWQDAIVKYNVLKR
jgi:hypothetical protein